MLSLEGKQLGNYDVIRRIRVGGMGAVYEGRQRTAFDRRVAIKVILGDYASDRDMRRRFAREAHTVARLHHPHILPLIEFGDEQGILYLVMPFIDGGTLTSYLRRSFPDLSEVAAIYQQLLDAVEYAHDEGLIHRDIKSSNVLLEMRRSGPPYVYLADFGLVRTSRQTALEQVGKPIPLDQVPGTPHYMAPEQTRGIITTLTDIYAMGVLLYQMLTGQLPYSNEDDIKVIEMHLYDPIPSPCDHDNSLPAELGDVVRKAMAKRPEERYKTIAELRTAFLAAIKGPIAIVQEDEPPIELVYPGSSAPLYPVPPVPALKRPAPAQSARLDQPPKRVVSTALDPPFAAVREDVPVPQPRRLRNAAPAPIIVREREKHERQRTTENVKPKPRITEEPVKRQRKRPVVPIVMATIVPVILLILLVMPRVLGVSFFPSGFPIFGTPPVATVFVTPQSKTLQDKYVLTASTAVKEPDLTTRTIPARAATDALSASSVVATTDTKTIPGNKAQGRVMFVNTTHEPVTVPAQLLLTSNAGVQIEVTQSVQVPQHAHNQDGVATAPAIAVNPGVVGNIPAHSLDGPCCSNGVSVSNNDGFSGGVDVQTQHLVAQADLDAVKKTLTNKLQVQISQQLQKQLATNEVMTGQVQYDPAKVTSDTPVGAQADKVTVTVSESGSVTIYNSNVASRTAAQLLSKVALDTLGNGYQMQGTPAIATPRVVESGRPGVVYVSVSVHAVWMYALSSDQLNQWRQSIRGATSDVALAYLNNQSGITRVQIHLPFGADHLPTSTDDIQFIVVSG